MVLKGKTFSDCSKAIQRLEVGRVVATAEVEGNLAFASGLLLCPSSYHRGQTSRAGLCDPTQMLSKSFNGVPWAPSSPSLSPLLCFPGPFTHSPPSVISRSIHPTPPSPRICHSSLGHCPSLSSSTLQF